MLDAARSHERRRMEEYRRLLELVAGRSEDLEAFARAQIATEETHISERHGRVAARARRAALARSTTLIVRLAPGRTGDHVVMIVILLADPDPETGVSFVARWSRRAIR